LLFSPLEPDHDPSLRRFLDPCGGGFGAVACAGMLAGEGFAWDQLPRPHFPAKARQVIYLFIHGGPSHVDLFDPKPALTRYAGQPLPESFGEVKTRRKVATNPLLAPVMPFQKHGESGIEVSDFLPHIASQVDHLCHALFHLNEFVYVD
jgi:Protein of unknown function (DUF1501)